MPQSNKKCVICLAPAIATAVIVRHHFPLCAAHHGAYSQEVGQPPTAGKPTLSILFAMVVERMDWRMYKLEKRRKEEMAEIDIYVTYYEGHYELWLGPECHDLEEADLTTVFIPTHAAKIIAHQRALRASSNTSVKFKHPYTPDMSPESLQPDQFRYIGLAEL